MFTKKYSVKIKGITDEELEHIVAGDRVAAGRPSVIQGKQWINIFGILFWKTKGLEYTKPTGTSRQVE